MVDTKELFAFESIISDSESLDSVFESLLDFSSTDAICEAADPNKQGAFKKMADFVKTTFTKIMNFIRSIANRVRMYFAKKSNDKLSRKFDKAYYKFEDRKDPEDAPLKGIDNATAEFILGTASHYYEETYGREVNGKHQYGTFYEMDAKKDVSEGVTVRDLTQAAKVQKANFERALQALSYVDPKEVDEFDKTMKELNAVKKNLQRILTIVSNVDKYISKSDSPVKETKSDGDKTDEKKDASESVINFDDEIEGYDYYSIFESYYDEEDDEEAEEGVVGKALAYACVATIATMGAYGINRAIDKSSNLVDKAFRKHLGTATVKVGDKEQKVDVYTVKFSKKYGFDESFYQRVYKYAVDQKTIDAVLGTAVNAAVNNYKRSIWKNKTIDKNYKNQLKTKFRIKDNIRLKTEVINHKLAVVLRYKLAGIENFSCEYFVDIFSGKIWQRTTTIMVY